MHRNVIDLKDYIIKLIFTLMKNIIINSLFLLICFNIFGQVDKDSTHLKYNHEGVVFESAFDPTFKQKDKINNADYVFEGTIIKRSYYFRNKQPIISDIVKVTKIFRGNLKLGTIEIINYSDIAFSERQSFESSSLKIDTFGIFFCKRTKELTYDVRYNIDIVENKVLLSDYDNDIKHNDNVFSRIMHSKYGYRGCGVPGKHPTKAQAYQYLRKFPNLKIPDIVEPDPIDTTIKQATFYHNYSKHEMDSLARVNNPNAFDSTGKFIGYGNPRITKVKKDTINSK
jgi:hypothetical protein